MPRWGEFMLNPSSTSMGSGQRMNTRTRGDNHNHHFSLLQGGQRSSHLNQRGFVSPRSIMRMSADYDTFNDGPTQLSPRGYISPGTHPVPTAMPMSTLISGGGGGGGPPSCTYGRRPTPRPTPSSQSNRPSPGFGSRLGYGQSGYQNQNRYNPTPYKPNLTPRYSNTYQSRGHSLGPIFPEEDEDTFFPPETLPPIQEVFAEYARSCGGGGGGDGSGGESDEMVDYLGTPIGYPQLHDNLSREKFEERLADFPELPLEAHRRIYLMGNEIVESFDVRLDRFYRGSLLDSVTDCVAVFTKKDRTGQRWLMVFKEDITRTVVKFNRLLTHSLVVSVVSPTAIEIEAAKNLYGPPTEMCVINFVNIEDASRFYKILEEGQATAWNHREVTHEQKLKTVFNKINQALAAADMEMLSGSVGIASGSGSGANGVRMMPLSGSSSGDVPQARSPFTFSLRNRGEGGILSQSQSSSSLTSKAPPGLSLRSMSRSPGPSGESYHHIADLDPDWRNNRGRRGSGDLREFNVTGLGAGTELRQSEQRDRERPRSTSSQQNRLLKKSLNLSMASKGQSSQGQSIPANLRLDGSGDCYNTSVKVNAMMSGGQKMKQHPTPTSLLIEDEPTIPGDIIFEVFVTVFVKLEPGDYAEFGTGTLQLLDHRDVALDELRLLDGDKREILQQYIYKWNSAVRRSPEDESKKSSVCVWDGAVCFSLEPDAVPERRDFKVRLSSEEEADDFVEAFMKSVEKARDESIRKRHICWYLQNKRDYKRTNAPNNSAPQQF